MKHLFIYTSHFPFTEMSEAFLMPELEAGINQIFPITLIPVNNATFRRAVPNGVIVDESLSRSSLISKILCTMLIVRYLRFYKIRDFKILVKPHLFFDAIKYLYASNLVYQDLKKRVKKYNDANTVFYSYWLSYTPIAFALYKYNNPHIRCKFIARGHGSDIYGIKIGHYYPLRDFVFKYIDTVYTISSYGQSYLLELYPFARNKILLSRLGVYRNLSMGKNDGIIRLISCSSVIPLKRVSLIFTSVYNFARTYFNYQIEWIHIGSGPLISDLEEKVERNKRSNLKIELKGLLNNKEILDYYKQTYITSFLLLSTTEGIPVSIMEAISSGIPVIATDVGGVSEIVNERTGKLLRCDFQQEEFNKALIEVIDCRDSMSESVFQYFEENYDAEKNFYQFYREL